MRASFQATFFHCLATLLAAAGLALPALAQNGLGGGSADKPLTPVEQRRAEVRAAYGLGEFQQEGGSRVVYGTDDRRDVYEILPAETVIQNLMQGVCVVCDDTEVSYNGNGTYTLSTINWTSYGGSPVCSSEPFYQQKTIGFCSGFLVGPDLIATAGHCVDSSSCGSTAFVFGFDQQSASVGPDSIVPADNVYFCVNVIDRAQIGDLDYCVLQVDRPVVGYTPLPIRHSGSVSDGDPLVMIGHPVTLPKKIEDGGMVQDADISTGWFYANLDAYGGNSGSMVANLNTGVIEGILVRGNTDFVFSGSCLVSNVCPNTGCSGDWEEVSKATTFESSVPELGLQVLPGAGVVHVGDVGGPFTDPNYPYMLSNPTSNPLNYRVHIVPGGTAPILINGGTSDVTGSYGGGGGVIALVASLDASVASLGTGVYSTDIEFIDETNNRTTTRTHVVEVGQTGFDVTPASDFATGGPSGGPFTATKVYTITSNHPTAVDVIVSAADSWVSIDGSTSPASFTLTGIGDSRNVTVGLSSDANLLGNGLYNSTVSFTNDTGGAGDTQRDVTLDVGRYTYYSDDVPQPINDNSTIVSSVFVPDGYCIADIDVDMDITHTYQGDLILDLESPAGTVVRLHNRTGGSTDNIQTRYDDATNPPDGPGTLADFNGESVIGTWTLTVSDNAGQDTGTLNAWSLRIAAASSGCPPVAYNMNVEVPNTGLSPITVNATSEGGSFDTIIMSLPAHGALYDPATGEHIRTTPYTLLNGDDTVNYEAVPAYEGPDAFTYKVNDGQDSNTATISLNVVTPTECQGDLNGDTLRDLTDLGILLGNWGSPCTSCDGDLDNDGNVDLTDLGMFLGDYGVSCP